MEKEIKRETHTIDATDISLGRLASQISILLQGKNKVDYAPYKDNGDFVIVKNFNKVKFTGRKMKNKIYYSHSGYLGGLTELPLIKLFKKDPNQVLRRAVMGMLPRNKLRNNMIKRLKIEE